MGPKDKPIVGGLQLGVTYPDALKIKPDLILQLGTKQESNSEKNKMNDKLNANGYDRNKGDQNPRDTDHIIEKQLGGPDHVSNLWPLSASKNRESGAKVLGQVKEIKKITGLGSLEGLYIKLKL